MQETDDLEVELKRGFIEEAAQLIADTETCFLTLETNPQDRPVLEQIFRLFHNLKGSAKAVGFDDLGTFTHEVESFLIKLKTGEATVSRVVVSFLLECNDRIRVIVEALRSDFNAKVDYSDLLSRVGALANGGGGAPEAAPEATPEAAPIEAGPTVAEVAALSEPPAVAESTPAPEANSQETSTPDSTSPDAEADELFQELANQISEEFDTITEHAETLQPQESSPPITIVPETSPEEALAAVIALPGNSSTAPASSASSPAPSAPATPGSSTSASSASSLPAAPAPAPTAAAPTPAAAAPAPVAAVKQPAAPASGGGAHAADESIRVSLTRVEKLINYVGELVIVQTVLQEQSNNTQSLLLRKTVHQLGKITKEVQDLSMSLRMIPLKQTFLKMQRIVRDTAQTVGKKVVLELIGEETEVDKTVLERLSDPLVHMIRNAVDHGIESPEVRKERKKPDVGTIKLSAYHQSGNLIIEIRDDGGGLDAAKLKAKAVQQGFLKPDNNIPDQEAFQLIFLNGLSTKEKVSDVSGRGVGMDVVKSNILQLQGDIQIESTLGQGSCFKIKLPLTLAIIHGMVIHSCGERYVIPLAHVHESLKPKREDLKYVSGVGEVLILRHENIPLYRIAHILNKKPKSGKEPWDGIAIVVRTLSTPFAVLVDDILGQYQIVIKSLGKEIQHLKGFSGSAILGDGRPALILEVAELIRKAKPIDNVISIQPAVEKRSAV